MSISATAVRFDEHAMWVELSDGRTLGVPLAWFPRLLHATPAQRESVERAARSFKITSAPSALSVLPAVMVLIATKLVLLGS